MEYNKENNVSLVNVKIDSGRKHQIRIHSASINMPVIGDRLHGNNEWDSDISLANKTLLDLQLCAYKLTFNCPLSRTKKQFILPEHLRPSLDVLDIE